MNLNKLMGGRRKVKDNYFVDKSDRKWWGIHIEYKNGVTSDGGDKNLNSDADAIQRATEMVNSVSNAKVVEAYRIDLPEGETLGTMTILKHIDVLDI